MKQKESQEFKERKELIRLQKEVDLIKHKYKMEELKFERENSLRVHDQILERGRIQNAEAKKRFQEREASKFFEGVK